MYLTPSLDSMDPIQFRGIWVYFMHGGSEIHYLYLREEYTDTYL